SVLQRRADPADEERFARISAALLAARAGRVRPGRDDKVVTAWNGLAIGALAECGLLLGEPGFVTAAQQAADLLTRVHLTGGRLGSSLRCGRTGRGGRGPGGLRLPGGGALAFARGHRGGPLAGTRGRSAGNGAAPVRGRQRRLL